MLVVAFLLSGTTGAAHHSFGAECDVNQPITITGVVTTLDWRNPHTFFYLDVTDNDGHAEKLLEQGVKITARHSRNQRCRAVIDDPVSLGDTNAPEVAQKTKLWHVSVTDEGAMRTWISCACAVIAVASATAERAAAHHSFGAEYDATKPVSITGVVTQIDWRSPHTFFFVDVTDKDGKVANWKFEGYPPSVLARIGWKKDVTMKPGDRITVTGWRARDGSNWAHSRDITLADGKKLMFGPPAGTGDGGNQPAVDVR